MKRRYILQVILILCSFFLSGCEKQQEKGTEIIDGAVSATDYPDFVRLGSYKNITVKMPEEIIVTKEDIQQQIDYALETSGESELTGKNVNAVSGYATIEEYKEKLKKNLEQLNQSARDTEFMNKAWDAALNNATLLKCPRDMLDRETSRVQAMYGDYTKLLGISYEEVLERFHLTDEDIREEALDYVKSDMMVYTIAKAENITVSGSEYTAEVNKRMKYYHVDTEQELADALGGDTDLHFVFLADKVMKFVADNSKIDKVYQ